MNYVRNAWYVAAWSSEVGTLKPYAAIILDEPIVIWRDATGALAALEDRCVHRLAPLSLGKCEGANLRCLYHGILFAPDGAVIEIPGQDQIPPLAVARSYPLVERHDWIWLWMGDPALADDSLIPPAISQRDEGWLLGHGKLEFACEARLLSDNLLDFSHVAYVHADSFGAPDSWSKSQQTVRNIPRGVRLERWVTSAVQQQNSSGPNDAWVTYDFMVPGIMVMQGAKYPVGTAAACGFGVPDAKIEAISRNCANQAVTPASGRTTSYFFSEGLGIAPEAEKALDRRMPIAFQALEEDRVFIEGQQRIIDRTPNARFIPVAIDKGVMLYNRLIDKMVREEEAQGALG